MKLVPTPLQRDATRSATTAATADHARSCRWRRERGWSWRWEEKQERRRNEWSTERPRILREVVGIEILMNAADFFFLFTSACVDVRPQFLMNVI